MGQAKDMMLVSTDRPSCYPKYRAQIDNSLSENQAPITNDVTINSCGQRLITKECIAMHTIFLV